MGPRTVATGEARAGRPERNPWAPIPKELPAPSGAEECSTAGSRVQQLNCLRPIRGGSAFSQNDHGFRPGRPGLHPWLHSCAPSGRTRAAECPQPFGAETLPPKVSRTQDEQRGRVLSAAVFSSAQRYFPATMRGGWNPPYPPVAPVSNRCVLPAVGWVIGPHRRMGHWTLP